MHVCVIRQVLIFPSFLEHPSIIFSFLDTLRSFLHSACSELLPPCGPHQMTRRATSGPRASSLTHVIEEITSVLVLLQGAFGASPDDGSDVWIEHGHQDAGSNHGQVQHQNMEEAKHRAKVRQQADKSQGAGRVQIQLQTRRTCLEATGSGLWSSRLYLKP